MTVGAINFLVSTSFDWERRFLLVSAQVKVHEREGGGAFGCCFFNVF